jgi:hypothetical protein
VWYSSGNRRIGGDELLPDARLKFLPNQRLGAAIKRRKPAMRKVLVLCLAICFVFALTAMAFDDMGKSATINGWVSDDKCGAKGANDKAEACTKKCLDKGAKMVIVTDKDQKVLMVDNPDALQAHIGHHVAVTGEVKGDNIHVDSAKML